MEKHRGFPGRLAGTDFQFTIRRGHKDGATEITERIRYPDRSYYALLRIDMKVAAVSFPELRER